MRYKAKTKDCRLLVKARTSFGENIDEDALNLFMRLYLRGFLKATLVRRNVIAYSGPVGISLYERLKRPISQRDFLFIMEQIVVAMQKVAANNLSIGNVVLDLRYVFINDVTKEIQFLYVPVADKPQSADVLGFIESIIYSVKPEKDSEVISRFTYFLKGQTAFSPEAVEKFIANEDRSVINTIKKQQIGQSGFMTNNPKHYHEHYEEKGKTFEVGDTAPINTPNTNMAAPYASMSRTVAPSPSNPRTAWPDDAASDVLPDDEATTILVEDEATTILTEDEATTILVDDGATALLVDDEGSTLPLDGRNAARFPKLSRVLTDETIVVNKPVFRIGKEQSYVDYFVANNNAVSRSHADIITRGRSYFVIDLNSKNHTYINDSMLPVQSETEIHDGDCLRLGNEEFIFHA